MLRATGPGRHCRARAPHPHCRRHPPSSSVTTC